MDNREVTHVSRDQDGNIQALGNPGENWSPRSKNAVIRDITGHVHGYYIKSGTKKVQIDVVHAEGRYLRTEPDDPEVMDNLADLPDVFVGDFSVISGELLVCDPCACEIAQRIKPAKNGLWHAALENTAQGRALTAVCEGEKSTGRLEEFEVGVDSAQAGIFCGSLYLSPENQTPGFYEACCDATQKNRSRAGIIMGRGVVASSTDDGSYGAFIGRNKDGEVVSIRIEFDE